MPTVQEKLADLERWRNIPKARRRVFAHNISQAEQPRGDPHHREVVFNRLINAVETPADYGQPNWRI